jgi:hypothetical protein
MGYEYLYYFFFEFYFIFQFIYFSESIKNFIFLISLFLFTYNLF